MERWDTRCQKTFQQINVHLKRQIEVCIALQNLCIL
jgi:hypothetical protein